jgi:hypothetical protein
MISDLFYIIGLFILIISFSNAINFIKFTRIRRWALTFKKVTKNDVVKKDFKSNEDYNIFTIYSLFLIIETFWFIIGLISSSWYIFLVLLCLSLFLIFINKYFGNNIILTAVGFIFSYLKFPVILFLILNHFHFHLDILLYLESCFTNS